MQGTEFGRPGCTGQGRISFSNYPDKSWQGSMVKAILVQGQKGHSPLLFVNMDIFNMPVRVDTWQLIRVVVLYTFGTEHNYNKCDGVQEPIVDVPLID